MSLQVLLVIAEESIYSGRFNQRIRESYINTIVTLQGVFPVNMMKH